MLSDYEGKQHNVKLFPLLQVRLLPFKRQGTNEELSIPDEPQVLLIASSCRQEQCRGSRWGLTLTEKQIQKKLIKYKNDPGKHRWP